MSKGWGKSSLFEVLARFGNREATNLEDKVYGLLGLVPLHRRLTPSSKGAVGVFIEATEEIIRQSQNLDVLCQSPWERSGAPQCSRLHHYPDGSDYKRPDGLPSWAIDFGARGLSWDAGRSYSTRELMFAGDETRKIFSAGGDFCEFCEDSWRVLDKTVLQLRGYLLGQIGPRRLQLPKELKEFALGNLEDELINGTYKATGEPKFQALWRTMVTDCKGYPIKRLKTKDIEKFGTILQKAHSEKSWPSDPLEYRDYEIMWERIEPNWDFYESMNGLFVLARKHVNPGDYIAVIEGAKVPLILQLASREGGDNHFEIVSPAYVHGYMNREARIQGTEGNLLKRKLLII